MASTQSHSGRAPPPPLYARLSVPLSTPFTLAFPIDNGNLIYLINREIWKVAVFDPVYVFRARAPA
jgi:hypothetical protein